MGGVLDATNIIPKILAAIITPISMDHQAYLGDNISKIAENKAGIIKENCPVTTYQNFNEAFNIIKKHAKLKKSNLIHIINEKQDISDNFINSNIFYVGSKDKVWYLKNSNLNLKLLKPNLIGDFQLINASLAIATLVTQKKFQIAPDSLSKAITKVNWPGRMQKINCGKLYNLLPTNSKLYIDGAHNEMAAINIARFIDDQKSNNKIAIIAMLKDKDSVNFIKAIANSFDLIICSEIQDEVSSLSCQDLKNITQKYHSNVCVINNISTAFNYINNNFSKQDNLIILSGSLYLIGEFLEYN
jgi:dihydrofolate synthase/folylpolyglutamate synthase